MTRRWPPRTTLGHRKPRPDAVVLLVASLLATVVRIVLSRRESRDRREASAILWVGLASLVLLELGPVAVWKAGTYLGDWQRHRHEEARERAFETYDHDHP